MALAFRRVTSAPLQDFDAAAPDGAVIGIVGDNASGADRLLELASGPARPASGSVDSTGTVRVFGPADLARQDMAGRAALAIELDRLRRTGAVALIFSHEEDLLRRLADEIWWLRDGRLAGRGDPEEMLAAYRQHVAAQVRARGAGETSPLSPKLRRGDGRAEVLRVETVGENGQPASVWRSGELAVARVTVRFHQAVPDPVIGIMIRTRIGLNVYGTNTELERLKLGPRAAGDTITVTFAFRCELCPGEYSLTVASHDPDGVWHDWLEDAVAFAVSDSRYTAGVANLRAQVSYLESST
jgi:hypothetical protein